MYQGISSIGGVENLRSQTDTLGNFTPCMLENVLACVSRQKKGRVPHAETQTSSTRQIMNTIKTERNGMDSHAK